MRCPRCLALPPLTDAIRAKTGWLQSSCPRKLYVCLMSGLSIRMIIALDRAGERKSPVDLSAREGPGISARASSACPRHGGAGERREGWQGGRVGKGGLTRALQEPFCLLPDPLMRSSDS